MRASNGTGLDPDAAVSMSGCMKISGHGISLDTSGKNGF